MTARKKLEDARANLLLDQPFFGFLCIQMSLVEIDPERHPPNLTDCETMATDGETIFYDSGFVLAQSRSALITVLCHEIAHCIFFHPWRMGTRNPMKWNYATDYAINIYLDDLGSCGPKGERTKWVWPTHNGKQIVLLDPKYREMSAEAIYEQLPQMPPDWTGGIGMVVPGGSGSGDQAENEAKISVMKGKITQAIGAAKAQGRLPEALRRSIEGILDPALPWQTILRQFIKDKVQSDYMWRRPLRSIFSATGGKIILPSLDGEGMGPIAVVIDTSGSITQDLLNEFMGEIQSIFEDCRPEFLHIIDCDAWVHDCWTFQRGETFSTPQFTGGGGTDFEPAFTYVSEMETQPVCLIYFTDMYGSFPANEPHYPTLWISYSSVDRAPFGQVLNIK